jgi:hypothetical protein
MPTPRKNAWSRWRERRWKKAQRRREQMEHRGDAESTAYTGLAAEANTTGLQGARYGGPGGGL